MSLLTKKQINNAERQISDQYGEDAVKNPLEDWNEETEQMFKEEYLAFVKKHHQGFNEDKYIDYGDFKISKNLLNRSKEGRICPICNKFTFDRRDVYHNAKYGCCLNCYILHKEGRTE